MSYILDALKKAEAERALGSIPGLHAPMATSPLPAPHFGAGGRRWTWGLPLLLACMLVLAAVIWQRQPAPVIAAAPPPVLVPAPAAVPLAQPAEPPKPPAAARPAIQAGAVHAPRPAPAAERLRLKKTAPPASAPAAEERLLTLRELPASIQRQIPALTVGGYIYSNNQSERSLLINNKLLREGDEVVAGLKLEKMMPSAAVLNYKGYRYRIPY
jgi:general secretion pathway protein B